MTGAGSTIAAIATPDGPARRGIVRLSGPGTAALVRGVWRAAGPAFDALAPRALLHGEFDDGRGRQPARLVWMRAPRSYTRQDVAEFHLPGARPLLECALGRLLELGAVAAGPGEFTRRAFLNGRLDLSQAEGVLALTEAESDDERRAALELLGGGLGEQGAALAASLVELSALCEASLDFEESQTGDVPRAEIGRQLEVARETLGGILAWEVRRSPPGTLPRIVLCGAPNAGKSSLWNALTGGRALVSELSGTTRDALEALWEPGGIATLLVDGPGLAQAGDPLGVRAQALHAGRRAGADLLLWVVAADRGPDQAAALAWEAEALGCAVRILVWNKVDLSGARAEPWPGLRAGCRSWVPTSARAGTGLGRLAGEVRAGLEDGCPSGGTRGATARALFERHRAALEGVGSGLAAAADLLSRGEPLDIVAEELRSARGALEELSGRSTPEDVLDRIFARFCLGK
jgi:tRNA modification GTPase